MKDPETIYWTDIYNKSFELRMHLETATDMLVQDFLLMFYFNGERHDEEIHKKICELESQQKKLREVIDWLKDLEGYCNWMSF